MELLNLKKSLKTKFNSWNYIVIFLLSIALSSKGQESLTEKDLHITKILMDDTSNLTEQNFININSQNGLSAYYKDTSNFSFFIKARPFVKGQSECSNNISKKLYSDILPLSEVKDFRVFWKDSLITFGLESYCGLYDIHFSDYQKNSGSQNIYVKGIMSDGKLFIRLKGGIKGKEYYIVYVFDNRRMLSKLYQPGK